MTFAWYKGDPRSDFTQLRRCVARAVRLDPLRRHQLKAAIWLVVLIANLIPVPATLTPQGGSSDVTSKDKRSGWSAQWGMEEVQLQGQEGGSIHGDRIRAP